MEKEPPFGFNWHSAASIAPHELNSGVGQLPPPRPQQQQQCFFGLGWELPMNQDGHFESALSSLVSSPTSNPPASAGNDSVAIGELIGRLGSICNSGESSPPSRYQSASNSCYSTPLSSPPKLNLSLIEQSRGGLMPMPANAMSLSAHHLAPFPADPGFAERAARFSCFNGRSYGSLAGQFGLPEAGKLSRASSSQSLMKAAAGGTSSGDGREAPMLDPAQPEMEMKRKLGSRTSVASSTLEDTELGAGQEASSVSDRLAAASIDASMKGHSENNARKRKTAPRGKAKEGSSTSSSAINQAKTTEQGNSDAKRYKTTGTGGKEKDAAAKPKAEQSGDSGQAQGKDNNAKPPEPPKDYIHVRARRGQATDSHSLAERVRREKISERMKFLQDLVPGCNKVTGKAVMLDEIINYVQSLQRQVEFLSMKLATVNPQLDFNMESRLPKDINEGRVQLPQPVYPMETTSMPFSYTSQDQVSLLPNAVTTGFEMQCSSAQSDSCQRSLSMKLPSFDGFTDVASQLASFWEDDLQSVVQMGLGQNQETAFSSQRIHSQIPASHIRFKP